MRGLTRVALTAVTAMMLLVSWAATANATPALSLPAPPAAGTTPLLVKLASPYPTFWQAGVGWTRADTARLLYIIATDPYLHEFVDGQAVTVANIGPISLYPFKPLGAMCNLFWSRPTDYAGPLPMLWLDLSGKDRPPYQVSFVFAEAHGVKSTSVEVDFDPGLVSSYGRLNNAAGSYSSIVPPWALMMALSYPPAATD
jgi:hypothetical protein